MKQRLQQFQEQQRMLLKVGSPQLPSSPQLMQPPSPQVPQQMSPQPEPNFALQTPKVSFPKVLPDHFKMIFLFHFQHNLQTTQYHVELFDVGFFYLQIYDIFT